MVVMENTKPKSRLKKVLIIIGIIILVIAIGIFILLKLTILKTFPKLKGEPEISKWYEIEVDGAKSSNGSE
jgi:flagellar basal body-associated protein FliL